MLLTMPLFKMVNTVTLDSAVRYKTWYWRVQYQISYTHQQASNRLITKESLVEAVVQVCECLWMLLSAAGLVLNEYQHVPFCHVCNHNAKLILDWPQRAVCSWLFQYDLSLSVSTSGIVNTFPDSECNRNPLGHITERVEAPTLFLFPVD